MDDVQVRSLEDSDLEKVLWLLLDLREYARTSAAINLEHVKTIFTHMKSRPDRYKNLVGLVREEVVGFLSLIYYKSFYHEGGTALINELIVSRAHRGKGIGTALVMKAKAISVADGMDEIEVGTESFNARAKDFYRRVGFGEEYILLGTSLTKRPTETEHVS